MSLRIKTPVYTTSVLRTASLKMGTMPKLPTRMESLHTNFNNKNKLKNSWINTIRNIVFIITDFQQWFFYLQVRNICFAYELLWYNLNACVDGDLVDTKNCSGKCWRRVGEGGRRAFSANKTSQTFFPNTNLRWWGGRGIQTFFDLYFSEIFLIFNTFRIPAFRRPLDKLGLLSWLFFGGCYTLQ